MEVSDLQRIRQWGSVILFGWRLSGGEPQIGLSFDPDERIWPLDVILKNWLVRLNIRYINAHRAERATLATQSNAQNLRAWSTTTRSMSEDVRLVFGDRIAELLKVAAQRLEEATKELEDAISWPAQYIVNPRSDPKSLAELFLNIDLWAFEEFMKALDELSRSVGRPVHLQSDTFHNALAAGYRELEKLGLPTRDSDAWKARLWRLEQRILPAERDNLMVDVLLALQEGPFDREGQAVTRAEEIPPSA